MLVTILDQLDLLIVHHDTNHCQVVINVAVCGLLASMPNVWARSHTLAQLNACDRSQSNALVFLQRHEPAQKLATRANAYHPQLWREQYWGPDSISSAHQQIKQMHAHSDQHAWPHSCMCSTYIVTTPAMAKSVSACTLVRGGSHQLVWRSGAVSCRLIMIKPKASTIRVIVQMNNPTRKLLFQTTATEIRHLFHMTRCPWALSPGPMVSS